MDFHSLKRKELQALCKKHGIPANLTNREMADRLASNFKENEDLVSSSSSPLEICSENEVTVGKKQSKKVRFSPESENQTFEYEVSVYQMPKRATRHTMSKNPAQVLESAPKSEDIKKLEGCQLRVTRSRVQNVVKEDINTVSSPLSEDIKKLEGCQLRVTRSRVQNAFKEDINTVSSPPVGRKRIRGVKKSKDAKEVDDIGDSESLQLGKKGDVKNDTGGLCGRQLRSRKNVTVTQGDAKKLWNGKGGDEVHLLDESSEANSGPKQQSTRNVEVVSRVTRQSRAQSKDIASIANNEVKVVVVKGGREAEKPQRRSKQAIAVTSQHQAPLRRGRRKTVILIAPAPEFENQEDIGKETTEEQQKSSRNSSRYSLSGTFEEDPIAISENDQRVKHQTQEPILEEEKTSSREHHPPTQKPQRRSSRNTSISASLAPPAPTVKVVEKEQQSKCTMAILEEEAAPTNSLPSPGELPTGKDVLVVVSEHAGNEYNLDVHVSKQVVKNSDTCSNKSRKGLRRNSGAEKQLRFAEASPLFLKMEECKESSRNMEENLIASCVKLIGPSTDLEVKQSAHGSMAVYEKESNFVEDAIEKLVPGGNIESEVTCMSSQTVNTTCLLDYANFSDPKCLKFESYSSHVVDSSQITFPYRSHGKGVYDQEMKEDLKLTDTHYAHESLIVYKEDITLLESEKEMVVQVDAAGSEMDRHSSSWSLQQRGAVSDSNRVKSRQVEFQSNVINMDEITCRAYGLSDQRDLTGATSTYLQSEEELGTELAGGENTNFTSYNVTAADRTPFAEAQIGVELKDTEVTAAESVKEEVLNLNKFGEISGFKIELENPLKKAEKIIFTDASREGIPQIQSSVEAAENQESIAKSHRAIVEIDTQKISVNQQSSYCNSVAPGTPCEPVPGNQLEDKCSAEAADTAGRKMFDQERSEDLNPGIAPCIHESVLMYEESPGLVKNDEEIRIHDDYFESESSPSLNRTGAVENSNLVESRMVDFGISSGKVVSPVVVSLADIFSSATQGDHPGKSSSRMELDKENTTRLVKNYEEIRIHDCYIESESSASLNRTGAVDDSNLVESRMDDSGSNCTKVVSPETVSLADIFSSASQGDLAGKSSSRMQLEKVLQEPSENIKSTGYDMDAEGIRNLFLEDQERSEDPGPGSAPCFNESVFMYEENTTRLVKNDEEIRIHNRYIETECSPSLNRIGAVYDSNLVESRMDDSGSSCTKVVSPETVSLADIFSSASQGKHAGKSSSRMEPEKVSEIQEPFENIKSMSYNMDAEEIRNPVPEDQTKGKSENATISGPLNEFGVSIGLKRGPEIPFKTSEKPTATEFSDGEEIILAESSVKTEKQEYRTEIDVAAITGTPNTTEMKYISSSDTAPRGTPVGLAAQSQDKLFSAGIAESIAGNEICNQDMEINLVDDEKEKLLQDDTIKGETSNELKPDKGSDGSFINVSGETLEKPCEVLDGEGICSVLSPEENGICNEKLPHSSSPAINDTQEKSEAVCMDIKNTRIEIPVNILPQIELEQFDNESETQKQGAESGEVNAGTFTQALPPENLTAPIISEAFSMSPLDHALVDGERNASGEGVVDHPFSIDFVATMDGNRIIEGGETDGVEEDNIVEEIASALKLEVTDYSSDEVDAELYDTDMSDPKTIFQKTDTFAAKQLDTAFAIDEVGIEDGDKATDSHQGSLHGDAQEDISSFADKPCSKLEIEKEEHLQAMNDIDHVGGTEISTECKEHKLLDELNFTNMEMSLFCGNNDEVKETDANAGDSIRECNSSEFKEGDPVAITDAEDTKFSVKKDGPEDTEETMGLREDFPGQDAAMADKSPLLKSSEADRVVDGEAAAAFRTELNLLNGSAKKETSNSVSVKQLISSIMKSKSNSRLIQRTPKRQIFHDMKENEGGIAKRVQIGNKTTPKTLSKLRRPLDRI